MKKHDIININQFITYEKKKRKIYQSIRFFDLHWLALFIGFSKKSKVY